MRILKARNVNHALPIGLYLLREQGVRRESRNGPMIEVPFPVTTVYEKPEQCVLFCQYRDANPYFHFFESLWMLAGKNDVEFVKNFAGNMAKFSDNSVTLHGAYGFRWRNHFKFDQLDFLIKEIRRNPDSRRLVMAMWDPASDIEGLSLDHPCNTHIYFRVRDGQLDMTVCNRSNDVIWGAYGANAVHMAMLQRYVAMKTEYAVGVYYQVSNSYHYYPEIDKQRRVVEDCAEIDDRYGEVSHCQFLYFDETPAQWDMDLSAFFNGLYDQLMTIFFTETVIPMWNSWRCWKLGDTVGAVEQAQRIQAEDWGIACVEWMERRVK